MGPAGPDPLLLPAESPAEVATDWLGGALSTGGAELVATGASGVGGAELVVTGASVVVAGAGS